MNTSTDTVTTDFTPDEARQAQAFIQAVFKPHSSIAELPRIDKAALDKLGVLIHKYLDPEGREQFTNDLRAAQPR
jgi:hypothetical protein